MGWTLVSGETQIARFEQLDVDMPWFFCSFQPTAAFAAVEPLFLEQEQALAANDWDAAERVWSSMHKRMKLVPDDPAEQPIEEFLIRLDGDHARLRYEPT
jgi:pentatricopeptide repeat protein